MFPGLCTLCLNVSNPADMRRFYETLGFKVHADRPGSVLVNNGDTDIALMTFLEEPCLNFRGADPFEMYRAMTSAGLEVSGQPSAYDMATHQADADGVSWLTTDPDGNVVFFDTNELEKGRDGRELALQRVLDATAKELVNVGASASCRDAFRSHVLDVFVSAEQRVRIGRTLDTSSLTDDGAYAGRFVLCLSVEDTRAAKAFYRGMGFEVTGNDDEKWVQMGNGDWALSLMTFLSQNWLNFRGSDPFEIYERLSATGLALEGEPSRYTEEEFGVPGAHWQTKDPDGNVVYFDTSDPEVIVPGGADAVNSVFERCLRRLAAIEADPDCVKVFRTHVVEPFSQGPVT